MIKRTTVRYWPFSFSLPFSSHTQIKSLKEIVNQKGKSEKKMKGWDREFIQVSPITRNLNRHEVHYFCRIKTDVMQREMISFFVPLFIHIRWRLTHSKATCSSRACAGPVGIIDSSQTSQKEMENIFACSCWFFIYLFYFL